MVEVLSNLASGQHCECLNFSMLGVGIVEGRQICTAHLGHHGGLSSVLGVDTELGV